MKCIGLSRLAMPRAYDKGEGKPTGHQGAPGGGATPGIAVSPLSPCGAGDAAGLARCPYKFALLEQSVAGTV